MTESDDELQGEQRRIDELYARLDELRRHTEAALAHTRLSAPSGSHQNRSERDAFAGLYEQRLAQLRAVEERLCFGRFDTRTGERRYVGRIGLSDDERRQLLLDWRAPAARWFYQATAAQPGDVVRRRHLTTRGRDVVAIEDDVLDVAALGPDAASALSGEGALLAAVSAHRTGRMSDIVATIQAEQDQVIRSELPGVLVVQGGPGTGKTAVALHRAAYLLYTHRERLARSGVLLVGPSPVFLRYIEKVLPSLGETGVVMATPGELFPGVIAVDDDEPAAAALKGDLAMARVVAAAVRARQRVPDAPRWLTVEGHRLVLRPQVVAAAQARARRGHRPHNLARVDYVKEILDQLAGQYARVLGVRLSADNRVELIADLRDCLDVRREVNLTWMPLTPQRLLEELFADPARLAEAAPQLDARRRDLLQRAKGSPWTISDVALLDEAAELIGDDELTQQQARRAVEQARREQLRYARGVLEMSNTARGLVSAEQLAERFAETGPVLTAAERAVADRSWAYGHVVVDEAQELSAMAWRLLMRRCPARSMTLVGDLAQTGSAAGARSWGEVLDRYVEGRWRLERLSVNYRTPAAVMRLAADVAAASGLDADVPTSAREGDWPPLVVQLPAAAPDDAWARGVLTGVRAELDLLGDGRLAVIAPRSLSAVLHPLLLETFGERVVAPVHRADRGLDLPVSVLCVEQAKGLEFDAVVLVEPAGILAESPRGANDLYVALTRPTQRLRILHAEALPAGFEQLAPST